MASELCFCCQHQEGVSSLKMGLLGVDWPRKLAPVGRDQLSTAPSDRFASEGIRLGYIR